jgi:hypothetical protein
LQEAKLQHSTPYLLTAAGKAAGATLAFIVFLLLLLGLRRRALPHVLNWEHRLMNQLSARGLVYLAQLVRLLRWTLHLAAWVLILAITFEWISICLRWFPYTRPWGDGLQEKFWEVLGGILRAVLDALPNLLVIVVILAFARGGIGILRGFFSGVETAKVKTAWMDVEAARATRRILTIIVWLLAKDLTREYPRSPRETLAGYVIPIRFGRAFSLLVKVWANDSQFTCVPPHP